MMRRSRLNNLLGTMILLLFTTACTSIEQHYHAFNDHQWDYKDSVSFKVIIDKPGTYAYSILLRQGNNYPYSNIWISSTVIGPDKTINRRLYPLTLADNSGNWLGQGPGNSIDNRFLVNPGLHFTKPGTYIFSLKQDMRTNHLQGINEVGIRLKRVALAF